jgi:hypothetical protein
MISSFLEIYDFNFWPLGQQRAYQAQIKGAIGAKPSRREGVGWSKSDKCRLWVIPDRAPRSCLPFDVRFSPKATD